MNKRAIGLMWLVCEALALPLLTLGCSSDAKPAATTPDEPEEMPTGACVGAPEFSLDMEAIGRDKAIKAVLVSAKPAPPVRKTNDWLVEFRDMDDQPLSDVTIGMVQPFMPEHGHDGTFAPTVTPGAEPGQFDVADINLWMPGTWEVRFTVESESVGPDYVVFETCIPE